jgi:hypothetical protein
VLPREQVRVIHGGNVMWRRLDLFVADGGAPRSYTMMVSGLGGGRRRLELLVGVLQSR